MYVISALAYSCWRGAVSLLLIVRTIVVYGADLSMKLYDRYVSMCG